MTSAPTRLLTRDSQAPAPPLVGNSAAMHRVREAAVRATRSSAPVVICGESGTGKRLLARVIHLAGGAAVSSLTVVDCATASRGEIDDAVSQLLARPRTNTAMHDGGATATLVLAHADALRPEALRGLAARIGPEKCAAHSARIIYTFRGASPADGSIGAHLLGTQQAIVIDVSPLRERRSDIPALVQYMRARYEDLRGESAPEISGELLADLAGAEWPGNVRQLQQVVEQVLGGPVRGVALATRGSKAPRAMATVERDAGGAMAGRAPAGASAVGALAGRASAGASAVGADVGVACEQGWSLARLEREYILRTLEKLRGNQTRAAEVLGIDRRTLHRKLKAYGLRVMRGSGAGTVRTA